MFSHAVTLGSCRNTSHFFLRVVISPWPRVRGRGLNRCLLVCPEVMQVNKPHTEHSAPNDDDKAQLRFPFVFLLRKLAVDPVCQELQPRLRLLHLFCVIYFFIFFFVFYLASLHPCFWWFRLRLVIKKFQKIQSCIASPDKKLALKNTVARGRQQLWKAEKAALTGEVSQLKVFVNRGSPKYFQKGTQVV